MVALKHFLFPFVLMILVAPDLSQANPCERSMDEVTVEFTIRLGLLDGTTHVNQANKTMMRLISRVDGLSFEGQVTGRKSLTVRFTGPRHLALVYAELYQSMLGL